MYKLIQMFRSRERQIDFFIFLVGTTLCGYSIYMLMNKSGILHMQVLGARDALIEIAIFACIAMIGSYFKDLRWIILEIVIFAYLHQMLLACLVACTYIFLTVLIGRCFHKDIVVSFFIGVLVLTLMYSILSILKIGSIKNIVTLDLILFVFFLFVGRKNRQFMHIQWKVSFSEYYKYLIIMIFFLISIGKANLSLDYDSIWYGLRGPFALDANEGIYENLGLIGAVYMYSKGFETYMLPLSNTFSYSFFYAGNIALTGCILFMSYRIAQCWKKNSKTLLWIPVLVSAIPSVISMSVTSKSDIFTLLFQLILIYFCIKDFEKESDINFILIFSVYIYQQTLKSSAAIFSTSIILAYVLCKLIYRLIFRLISLEEHSDKVGIITNTKKIHKISYVILVLALIDIIAIWGRTYLFTGVPASSLWGRVFSLLGFQYKYPYDYNNFNDRVYQVKISKESIIDLCKQLYNFFVLPDTDRMDHIVIAWGSILIPFLLVCMFLLLIVYWTKIKKQLKLPQNGFLAMLVVGELLGCVLSIWWLNIKPDGNYFLLFYVVVVLGLILFMDCLCFDNNSKKPIGAIFIIDTIIISNMVIACSVNWAWCNKFTDISLYNNGYYNHREEYKNSVIESGYQDIYEILSENPKNKVLAYGVHPGIERIPCIIESEFDINYWGNPSLMASVDSFLQFVNYENYDYIFIQKGYLYDYEQSYKNICYLFDNNCIESLYYENGYVLLKLGNNNVNEEELKETFMSYYSTMGYCVQNPISKSNVYEDGWAGDDATITLHTYNSGLISLSIWDPNWQKHVGGEIKVYIDNEEYCTLLSAETITITLSATGDDDVIIRLKSSFADVAEAPDGRTLSFLITELKSIE